MNKILITLFIPICIATVANGQVKVGATPTGKHAKAVQTAKDAKQEWKERKAQAKKVGEYAKAKDKYKKKYKKLKKQEVRKWKKDSIQNPDIEKPQWEWNEKDSLAISEKILEESNFPKEYKALMENPPKLPKKDSISWKELKRDSTLVNRAQEKAESAVENKAKEYLPEELGQEQGNPLTDLSSDNVTDLNADNPLGGQQPPDVQDIKKPNKPNPNLIKPDKARDLFKKIDPEQFQKVQENITKLKKKYSSLPDTRFPEEGTKRNSLEDLPFKKRLYFGGNVNLSSTDPLILDVGLQVGYWMNKKWMAGVGITLREQFNNQDSTSLTGDAYGYSLFTRYNLVKSFYAWGELQRQVNKSLINNESSGPATWEEAYLLGIGRDFKIGPVNLTTLVMYDFNYQNNDLNNRPLVFRLGFQLSKKPE